MKKFLLYILIFVAIVGLFSFPLDTQAADIPAQTAEGKCVYQNISENAGKEGTVATYDPSYRKTPEEFCGLNTRNMEWIATGATTASPPITPYQQCINRRSTSEDCSILVGAPNYNNLTPSSTPSSTPVDLKYTLLAPLPCPPDAAGCDSDGKFTTFDPTNADAAFGGYLNLMITIFIGLCAVLAVIMIVAGGIEYMTTDLVSSKEAGKERIKNAILGLLLALGAWTLLNQINPDLLDVSLRSLEDVTVEVIIKEFEISGSGALSRDGRDIKIDFNTEAYPAAVNAQAKTGVDAALILAVFHQETTSGVNVGRCFPNDTNAKMADAEKNALASIVGQSSVATTPVSCALSSGRGGAIGLTQFLPSTWVEIAKNQNAEAILGHKPDPWNTNDALMMTALYLKAKGGATNQEEAACKYMSGNVCNGRGPKYANEVMAKKNNLQKQIDKAKKEGTIS